MKIVLGIVASAALGLALGGCGSSSSSDGIGGPDLGAVEARFDHPDGTFDGSNASRVIAGGSNGKSSAAGLNFGESSSSGGSDDVSKKSLVGVHVLDASSGRSSPFSGCSALFAGQQSGSCACPGGGSLEYTLSGGGQGTVRDSIMNFRMNACAYEDTRIDGSELFASHIDTSDSKNPITSFVLAVDATVTHAAKTEHIDLQMRYGNGGYEIAVKVDDGWVVVSVKTSDDGKGGTTISVRDRNGSWTCTSSDGHGSCSNDKGQTTTY